MEELGGDGQRLEALVELSRACPSLICTVGSSRFLVTMLCE